MAMPRKIRVEFSEVFPHGMYAVSAVTQVTDFEKSTQDKPVYATDEETGLLVWQVDVMDGDPEARKADRQISIKILAKQQPVLPPSNGLPFTSILPLTGRSKARDVSEYSVAQASSSISAWSAVLRLL